MKLPCAYNAPRIDDVRDRVMRAVKSENLVRMLVEEIKPLAELDVYIALGPLADRTEVTLNPTSVLPGIAAESRDCCEISTPQTRLTEFRREISKNTSRISPGFRTCA